MQGKLKSVLHIFALMIILLLTMALSACNKECKHNYSSEITKEATCTERGVRTYTCKLCDDSYTVPIMFIGHDEIMYAAKSPSCSEIGWDAYIECQRDGCDYSTKIEKPMLEHNYVAVVNSPTCTQKGYTTYTCFCGNSYNGDYVDPLGHKEVIDNQVNPTCTQSGLTKGKHCTVCGEATVAQIVVDALGHSYTSVITPATCEDDGYTTYTCYCGYSYVGDTVSAHGHTEVIDEGIAATCTQNGISEGKHCSVCNEIIIEQTEIPARGHTEVIDAYVAPTCTKSGYTEGKRCSECLIILVAQTEIPAEGHDFSEWTVTIHPTESEQGEKRRDCNNCDKCEISIIAMLDHDHSRWQMIILEAIAPTCTNTGLTAGEKCSGCSEIIVEQKVLPANGHSYTHIITSPTCTADGYTVHTCHCGYSYTDGYINAFGHTEVIDEAVVPTCTENGLTQGKHCSGCGKVLEEQTTVPARGHAVMTEVGIAPLVLFRGLPTERIAADAMKLLRSRR